MFAMKMGRTTLKRIAGVCEDSKLINMFTSGNNPKEDVYRRLLKDGNQRVLKKSFYLV